MNNLELNKIYCESNLETMKRMEDKSIDYILTSPPYNINDSKYNKYKDNLNDYFENQKNLINEMLRVTKNHIFYNTQMVSGNKFDLHKLIGHFAENIKEVLIWNKTYGAPTMPGLFNSAFEYIIIFSNQNVNQRKFNDANWKQGTQNNVFKILNSHSNPFADVHKAIMPLDIPRYFMINFGKENDIWYDPYMGTGTTAVACIEEKRKFIGSEISQEYVDLANKRLKPYLTQQSLF
jgi:site-specific DNA-methyltransferase (adenine-specific)/modification methylase